METKFDSFKVESLELTEEQHAIACKILKENIRMVDSYTLDDTDSDDVGYWLEDAEGLGDTERADFLKRALDEGAEVYTLTEHLGRFKQPIGEVVVY